MRILAVAAALALAGCAASNAEVAVGSKRQQREAAMTACMAERGFKYEASVPETPSADALRRTHGHYSSLRKFREKYGYAIFSGYVYRSTGEALGVDVHHPSPNEKNYFALSLTQTIAYDDAGRACLTWAAESVLGKDVTDESDLFRQYAEAHDARVKREFDTDPELVALADDYAACLRAKGYPVSTASPSRIDTLEPSRFLAKLWELGRKQMPDARADENYVPHLSSAEAMPYLREEIASALDDLECGREFFAAYHPRLRAVTAQVAREWGFD